MNELELSNLKRALAHKEGSNGSSIWDSLAQGGYEIELALAYGKVFWPDLIEVKGYVFVAEHYDADYFEQVLRDVDISLIESTINTTYLRDLFGDKDADESVWEELGELLTRSWKARAEAMFPHMKFCSKFAWYSDDIGDPAITLYQSKEVCS